MVSGLGYFYRSPHEVRQPLKAGVLGWALIEEVWPGAHKHGL